MQLPLPSSPPCRSSSSGKCAPCSSKLTAIADSPRTGSKSTSPARLCASRIHTPLPPTTPSGPSGTRRARPGSTACSAHTVTPSKPCPSSFPRPSSWPRATRCRRPPSVRAVPSEPCTSLIQSRQAQRGSSVASPSLGPMRALVVPLRTTLVDSNSAGDPKKRSSSIFARAGEGGALTARLCVQAS